MADYTIDVEVVGDNKLSGAMRQAQQDVRNFETEAQRASQGTQQFDQSTQSLGRTVTNVMQGVLGGIAIRQVVNYAEQMYQVGEQTRIASSTFSALVGGAGQATSALALMRQQTKGVVDDLTLMSGATQLLSLNLAQNYQQASEMIANAVRLGTTVGGLAPAEAIANFANLLKNQSIQRLDSVGLNVSQVRDRVEELKAAGIDASTAFSQAVQEGMVTALDRLGGAADAGVTSVKRLQTAIENLYQAGSQNFSIGVNAIVDAGVALYDKAASAEALARRVDALVQRAGGASTRQYSGDLGGFIQATLDQILPSRIGANLVRTSDVDVRAIATEAINRSDVAAQIIQNASLLAARALSQYTGTYQSEIAAQMAARTRYGMMQQYSGQIGTISNLTRGALTLFGGSTETIPSYMSQNQLSVIQAAKDQADALLKTMKDNKDALQLSDADLQPYQTLSDYLGDVAKQAQTAADAFKNLKLASMLGQTNGGLSGEINQQVIDALKAGGASDKVIKQWTDTLQLASSEQTPESQAFRDQFIPMLLTLTPENAVKAIQNWTATMQQAALQGVPFETILGGGVGAAGGIFGGGGGGKTYTVKPGDTPSGMAAALGITLDQVAAITSWTPGKKNFYPGTYTLPGAGSWLDPAFNPPTYVSQFLPGNMQVGNGWGTGGAGVGAPLGMPNFTQLNGAANGADFVSISADLSTNMGSVATSTQDFSDSLGTARDYTSDIQTMIDDLTGTVHQVTIDLNVNVPAILKLLLGGGGDTPITPNTVRNNGGVVPGTTGRAVLVP